MIISLAGLPGSGKTAIAQALSEALHLPWYSVGDMRGLMAKERGITIDELNTLGETQAFTDKDVDDFQKHLGESGKSFIIDGRLSWYFIPHSFKVFLTIDPEVAAERIINAQKHGERTDEKTHLSISDTMADLSNRVASDQKRYKRYYGVDALDLSHYDLILDTSHAHPEEILQKILEKLPKS